MADERGSPWYAAAFGAHYPLLYQHRDQAEARRCLELLPRLAPLTGAAAGPILDLGCGDGRHLRWLAAAGHEVVGLDLSPHLLAAALARQGTRPLTLVRGDMRCLPFADGRCAAVLSLFTAFGYFGPPAANGQPVAEVARVLRPGGHWFLDYFDGDRVRAELGSGQPQVRDRELDCLQVRETRRYLVERRQVIKDVRLTARSGQETAAAAVGVGPEGLRYAEEVAVFTLAELDALAGGHAMVRVAAAGDYDGAPLGAGSRWILVYRKEQDRTA